MKIIEFKQVNISYLSKDRELKIECDDMWGNPEENKESLLAYYQRARAAHDDTVHAVYLYGQGGMGKSFVFKQLTEKLKPMTAKEKDYVIALDLQRQDDFADQLKCLADEIMTQMKKKELFPRFYMAYYSYKMKQGENAKEEERTTRWDKLKSDSSFSIISSAASMLTSFGTVSDVIDIANDGYKWFLNMRSQLQYKSVAKQIENMEEKELREQLVPYFASDFIKMAGTHHFVFLLDTIESMRYHVLRSGTEEDYLDWLAGKNGLFRLLPGCYWMMFGREEIFWEKYDPEWEQSFVSLEIKKPAEKAVRKYLEQQLRGGSKAKGDEDKLRQTVDVLIERTECYPLAIENSVDMYFRIWNDRLGKNLVTDENEVEKYRPRVEEVRDIITDCKGRKVISHRFMQYYTLQEREVLYTLVCLVNWTDDVLEKILWNGSVNNRLIYEEMCDTSFIKRNSDGSKSIRGIMLDTIMEECPVSLKKQILHAVLSRMQTGEVTDSYGMLYRSAVHIAGYYACEGFDGAMLGQEFIRWTNYLQENARIEELAQACEELINIADADNVNEDMILAAHIGYYFAGIYRKGQDTLHFEEELRMLSEQNNFGSLSCEMWKNMYHMAETAEAYKELCEITKSLMEKMKESGVLEIGDEYQMRAVRVENMEQLPEIFTSEQIETELETISDILENMNMGRKEIQRVKSLMWSGYYYNAAKTASKEQKDEYADKILKCMEKYRAYCSPGEAEKDIDLCRMELMSLRSHGVWDLYDNFSVVMRALRSMYEMYGDNAWTMPTAAEFVRYLMMIPDRTSVDERDIKILEHLFEAYYKDFCRDATAEKYRVLNIFNFWIGKATNMAAKDGEESGVDKSEIILQGIHRLNAGKYMDLKTVLVLLISCDMYCEDGFSTNSNALGEEWQVRRFCMNQLLLMKLLLKETENPGLRLPVFLRYFFGEMMEQEKPEVERKLLGILDWCGFDTEKAVREAEYSEKNNSPEFRILTHIKVWFWRMDTQADAWMANTVLYTAHVLLGKTDGPEQKILKKLKEEVNRYDDGTKKKFLSDMLDTAKHMGEEWYEYIREVLNGYFVHHTSEIDGYEEQITALIAAKDYDRARESMKKVADGSNYNRMYYVLFYIDIVLDKGTEHYIEHLDKRYEKSKDRSYVILRGYAYMKDWTNFVQYYWEERDSIWQGLLRKDGCFWRNPEELYRMLSCVKKAAEYAGDGNIVEDYTRKMCHAFSEVDNKSYADGVIAKLPEITEIIPFDEAWNKELCAKVINERNYDMVYENLRPYIEESELLDIFMESILKNEINISLKGHYSYAPDCISFFKGEYYKWLTGKFADALEERLQTEYPEECKIRDAYVYAIEEGYVEELQEICLKIVEAVNKTDKE